MNQTHWRQGLDHAVVTDVGLKRPDNQDSLAVVLASDQESWQERGHLFVVADGMGAHAAGELASQMAVETVSLGYHKLRDLPPPEALQQVMRDANAQIYDRGQASQKLRG
ncbi:MAG: PP2C family protein-serine/threonine phosphatase, partial [Planctomycetota bacterium]